MSDNHDNAADAEMAAILARIDAQIKADPAVLVPLTQQLLDQLETLLKDVVIDLEQLLPPDVES